MKRFASIGLAAVLATSSGCHMFSKKKTAQTPKEGKDLSTQVEKDFEQRWLERRSAELVAEGTPAPAARDQAVREFREKFSYTKASQLPAPPVQ